MGNIYLVIQPFIHRPAMLSILLSIVKIFIFHHIIYPGLVVRQNFIQHICRCIRNINASFLHIMLPAPNSYYSSQQSNHQHRNQGILSQGFTYILLKTAHSRTSSYNKFCKQDIRLVYKALSLRNIIPSKRVEENAFSSFILNQFLLITTAKNQSAKK